LENGLVFFYRGGPSGVDPEPTAILESPPGSQGGFGTVVAGTGDFDGDGFGDLAAVAMGRLGADVGEGAVYVFHGGPGGVETVARTVVGNPVGIPGWLFGHSAVEVVGNADGDGYVDLAVDGCLNGVGGPVLSGMYVYRGGRTGLEAEPYASLFDPSGSAGSMSSCRLAADDLDGDGLTDLMVSVPGSWAGVVGPGLVYVYSARTGEFPTSPGVILSYPFATEYTGGFGTDVAAAGDVNGDGNPDVVVGCRGCGTSAIADGAVILFPGAGEGLESSSAVALENPVAWADAQFGYSVE